MAFIATAAIASTPGCECEDNSTTQKTDGANNGGGSGQGTPQGSSKSTGGTPAGGTPAGGTTDGNGTQPKEADAQKQAREQQKRDADAQKEKEEKEAFEQLIKDEDARDKAGDEKAAAEEKRKKAQLKFKWLKECRKEIVNKVTSFQVASPTEANCKGQNVTDLATFITGCKVLKKTDTEGEKVDCNVMQSDKTFADNEKSPTKEQKTIKDWVGADFKKSFDLDALKTYLQKLDDMHAAFRKGDTAEAYKAGANQTIETNADLAFGATSGSNFTGKSLCGTHKYFGCTTANLMSHSDSAKIFQDQSMWEYVAGNSSIFQIVSPSVTKDLFKDAIGAVATHKNKITNYSNDADADAALKDHDDFKDTKAYEAEIDKAQKDFNEFDAKVKKGKGKDYTDDATKRRKAEERKFVPKKEEKTDQTPPKEEKSEK